MRTLPTSDQFELERLADGVYAALGTKSSAAYSNAGIIDLGDQTLIFDTFTTPQSAADLRRAAEQLTGRTASYVINSHAHADHWCGNQVFASQAVIIATHVTRAAMPDMAAYLKQVQHDPTEMEEALREEEERLQTEVDPRWRATLEASIPKGRRILESVPSMEFRLPDLTFEERLTFHGTRRRADLLAHGKGHTDSDAYLVLPEERIMFMGDLGFFQTQPFMVYCEPAAWTRQLEAMEGSDIQTFVPGHGPLGTKAHVSLVREYILTLEALVAQVVEAGGQVEDALQQSLPAPFDAWLVGEMDRFERNVRTLYQRCV